MKKYSLTTRANSRRTSRIKRALQIAAIVLGFVVLSYLAPKAFSTIGYVVTYPYFAVREWVAESTSSLPQYVRDRSELVAEISDLRSQLSTQQGSQGSLRVLMDENMQLRSMLGATTSSRLAAVVLARPNTLPYDVIQIDKGARDGVVEYAPVFLGLDQVIGYVTQVTPTYAFVSLITSPNFTTTVYILGPDVYTNAEGMGGGVLRLNVPQGVPLARGQLVLTPTVSSAIYGEVTAIESVPTEPQQYAYVTPTVPLQGLRFVSVGTQPLESSVQEVVYENVADAKTDLLTASVPVIESLETSSSSATSSVSAASSTLDTTVSN